MKTRVIAVDKLQLPTKPGNDCLVVIYSADSRQLGRRHLLGADTVSIGRGGDNTLVMDSDSVSRKHAAIRPITDGWLIEDLESTNGTYVNDTLVGSHLLQKGDQVKIGDTILKYLSGSDMETQYHETIYRMTIEDGLTGIHNKRYLLETLDREIPRARRHERPLTFLMFDIDKFKSINDTFGHLAGDYVLREVARIAKARRRLDDVVGRYGGEEFAVLLPETDELGGAQVADDIRKRIEAHAFTFENERIAVTASFGVAQLADERDVLGLIKDADDQLYRAKREGRNCTRSIGDVLT